MKHLIVTANENIDIQLLMIEISEIKGVKKVEEERSFVKTGNILNKEDYLNIVKEAENGPYDSSGEVFKKLDKKYGI